MRILFFLSISLALFAKSTVCLNMIVRNESEVIERCLKSAIPLIDSWVIVDTGSTDGTQTLIRKVMQGIPGELHERPWVDFAHNRQEALDLAKDKADYLLFIDADEEFQYAENFSWPELDFEVYYFTMREQKGIDNLRPSLINTSLPWKWRGVLHETLNMEIVKKAAILPTIVTFVPDYAPSGRSKLPGNKYARDAQVLEKAVEKEPENSRYVYYLAQSYLLSGNLPKALENYSRRCEMQSEDIPETFYALYYRAKVKEMMNDLEGAILAYAKAYAFRPMRAEPLFRSAVCYRRLGNPQIGYFFAKEALALPTPVDHSIEKTVYDYERQVELANCAMMTGRWQEGFDLTTALLANPVVPSALHHELTGNRSVAKTQLLLLQEKAEAQRE
ncbi:MAG: glycosyltransferase [Verrucomicrobiota bacterium]|nr:glycosyltransferase [Verrucomicrobiota bacterium]